MPRTPGPWIVVPEERAEHRWVVGEKDESSIASCEPAGPWTSRETADANAKAISAVPDFMEAAAMMTAAEQSGGDMWWRGFNMLKDAYKKAGGQFPSMDETGTCRKGDCCVCGGDTPQVRASCANWVR